jgi:uncharacterized protein with von Willebrand factor type A (vWA) domain
MTVADPFAGQVHDADELLVGFARALRAAGVPVTQDRTRAYLEATALVGLDYQRATYWAGRATLCSGPDDLDRYDQVFTAWFLGSEAPPPRSNRDERTVSQAALDNEEGGGSGEDLDEDTLNAMASEAEVLRHRDIGEMQPAEKARLTAMFETLRPRSPRRTANRRTPWRRGDVDAQRTLRQMLRRMGEPGEIAWRRRATRPRRVVMLVDVSGSMSGYADALLRLAHRFSHPGRGAPTRPGGVEVFTVGTRLTRVTRAMRMRDPERAIVAAGETVPDWSGGTRLGENLRMFMDRWGQRGLARGAVVVVFSDGWERGEAELLGEQMRRLRRVAHRVVWVNPHVGKDGYLPVQQGIVAALPHVDDLVAGHSLATFADLIEVVARA